MKLFYILLTLLLIHISCLCDYEGKASQKFCSTRSVDYNEVPDEFKDIYSQYVCCYIWIEYQGERVEGCFSASPEGAKNVVGCKSSGNTENTNNYNGKTNNETCIGNLCYNEYLILKSYMIIILILFIFY